MTQIFELSFIRKPGNQETTRIINLVTTAFSWSPGFLIKNLYLLGTFAFVFITTSVLFLLAGCHTQRENPDFLRLRLQQDPTTLDPAYIVDVDGGRVAAKLFSGLVRYDVMGKLEPDLAKSWRVSDDGREYSFVLRDDAFFSDGSKVTAADVKYSLERILSPQTRSPRARLFAILDGAAEYAQGRATEVSGIVADGTGQVTMRLKEPRASFLSTLSLPAAFVLQRKAVERWGTEFGFHPEGCGPFRLESWRRSDRIVLRANQAYFGSGPCLKGIEYRIIPEDFTASSEFAIGNLDILNPIPRGEFSWYVKTAPWRDRMVSRSGLNIYYVGFNCQRPPFDNVEVRRALNLAIDRDTVARNLLEGRAEPARGIVPPELKSGVITFPYSYDPQRARALLDAAGVALPMRASLYVSAGREEVAVATALQAFLAEVGIQVEIMQLEWSAFKEALDRSEADLFYLSWWSDIATAEDFLYPTFHSRNWGSPGNRAHFSDSEVDALLDAALREGDPSAFAQAESRIIDLAPWIFLWHRKETALFQPRISGLHLYPLYYSDKGTEVRIVESQPRLPNDIARKATITPRS